nr:MAG TPA: hypothetical protein [Crassvirales sp.]
MPVFKSQTDIACESSISLFANNIVNLIFEN